MPFSADWVALCEVCGFALVEWIQASLVEHHGIQADLFGGEDTVVDTERLSFFRRLVHNRLPPGDARRILHEDVLIFRKEF